MLLRYILLAIFLTFTTSSFAGKRDTIKYYTLEQIRNTEQFDSSVLMDYNDFFQRRMKNKVAYKDDRLGCTILFETDKYVYYGYSVYEKVYGKYYKTDKTILKNIFPKYDSIEGYHVKSLLDVYIEAAEKKIDRNAMGSFQKTDFIITLTKDNIEIDTKFVINSDAKLWFTRRFIWHTIVNKNTLAIIQHYTLQNGRRKK